MQRSDFLVLRNSIVNTSRQNKIFSGSKRMIRNVHTSGKKLLVVWVIFAAGERDSRLASQ